MNGTNGAAAITIHKPHAIAAQPSAQVEASLLEKVLIGGNLADLSPPQRVNYYRSVCESIGLNPLTRPFEYLTFQGKLTLYARRDAADQLRKIHGVSVSFAKSETVGDIYIVTATAMTRDGREDQATGAVSIKGLSGENLANAYMKAETKAKRRVTLSICGLGWADETEVDSIPGATRVSISAETGEIQGEAAAEPAKPVPAKDWNAIGASVEAELAEATTIEQIDTISKAFTPMFKGAPKAVSANVAALFKSARARVNAQPAEPTETSSND